ncbi:MAG: FHA domain-containing protein [Bacteriovoracales bacterium]|nr:FHA domain-containing protein [Bacteriovoracales bacterium]
MIHLEVKETKDFDILGEWKFNKNALIIGGFRSGSSDIKINNELFGKEAVTITIVKEKLFIELLGSDVSVLVNGKKTIGRAMVKKGELFRVGHTLFELKDFSYSEHDFSDKFYENLKKIIRGNHPVNTVIKRLEQHLKDE